MGGDQEIDDLISVEEAGLLFKDLKIILQPYDTSFGKMSNISVHTLVAWVQVPQTSKYCST